MLMIRGRRVRLCSLSEEDLEFIRTLRNMPENRRQFFTQKVITGEQQRAWYGKYENDDTDLMFVIKSIEGHRLGTAALYHIDDENRCAEFGRLIVLPEKRRRGIGGEAVRLLLAFAFDSLKLHRVFLGVFPDNISAVPFYEKIGFLPEGVSRDAVCLPDGTFRSVLHMAIFSKQRGRL